MIVTKKIIFALTLLFSGLSSADNLLIDGHPDSYTVIKGDTLWDISAIFLKSPWRWPEIWDKNKNIKNPHLIYPGDKLQLVYVNGNPELRMHRGKRVIKLSPKVKRTAIDGTIPTVPVDAIVPFLTQPRVLTEQQKSDLPYIVSYGGDHIMGGAGIQAYVRSIEDTSHRKFAIVRPGKPYKDADSGELLGYDAHFIGVAALQEVGDPATVLITSSEREALIGDLLVEIEETKAFRNFTPRKPLYFDKGSIIALLDGISQIGQYSTVVIDRGSDDNLQEGHVLQVQQEGEEVRDTVTENSEDTVKLPNLIAGNLLIFRTFKRVSFAIMMEAFRPMHVGDPVTTPRD